jgi:NADP-dependent 3-hydroxy acid dehydrogenase YdfG
VDSDVIDRASLQRLLDGTLKAFRKVDILINSAGTLKRAPTLDYPETEWVKILDTNLTGVLRACQIWPSHAGEKIRAHHQPCLPVIIPSAL